MSQRRQIGIKLDTDLLARIDGLAAKRKISRTALIEETMAALVNGGQAREPDPQPDAILVEGSTVIGKLPTISQVRAQRAAAQLKPKR